MRTNPLPTASNTGRITQNSIGSTKNKKSVSEETPDVKVEIGNHEDENVSKYKADTKKLAAIKQDFTRNTENFKTLVQRMIEKQGYTVKEVLEKIDRGETLSIEIDPETRLQAQTDISANGYLGVDQTATRLLDFAKAISGGDPSKIEMMENAFKEGYEAAKQAFGGELPDICQDTYDKVMEGFESWRSGENEA